MKRTSFVSRFVAGAVALGASLYAMGCDFSPVNYFSRNACDFLNCDVLFFVDDILPLSGAPIATSGGAPAEADSADEGGGHAH